MELNNENIKRVLSKNIKDLRISSNLTQENLAELSDISVNFLKDIESNRSGPSLKTLINICNSLSATPNELLKEFFQDSFNNSESLTQQINLLNNYQKEAIYTLIQFFRNNNM